MKRFLLCATLAISLLCASCAGGHGCEFESEWSYSGDEHWKSCSYSGCPESAARAAHSFGDPVTVKEPTEQAEGKAVSVCRVCLYERVTVLPALKHVHSLPESMTCDSREHWYTCSSCGERVDRAAHGRSEESVISEPTNDTPGEVRYICPDCGYSYTEELPPLPRTLTEAEWREAFVLDNMRIEHVFHMGSIPQKELFEVDGDLILATTTTKYYIKNTGMSIFPGLDFADRYGSFVHRENGVFTADKITVGSEALTYNFSNVRLVITDGRLVEVTYTVDFNSVIGSISHKYVISDWGRVKLEFDYLGKERLDAALAEEHFLGNITVRVAETRGGVNSETEYSVVDDVCMVKIFDENGKVTGSYVTPAVEVGPSMLGEMKKFLSNFDAASFIGDPDGGDDTGAVEYSYAGPETNVEGYGSIGQVSLVIKDGKIQTFYYSGNSGDPDVAYFFDYGGAS